MSTLRANTPTEPWDTVALKHVALSIQTGPFGSQLHAEDYSSGGRPVINPAHLRDGQIEPDSDCAVDDRTFGRLSQHELREGDVVIGRRGELGRCGVVTRNQAGWLCGTGSIRVRPDTRKLHSSWLRWLLAWSGSRDWLTLESVGSTMDNLGAETIGSMPIFVPPLRLQRLIADYLDRETARLDGLVSAKERVLGLVAEKRRALITRAVTRGLTPSAPLSDSGIPWLGEIPASWTVAQLRRFTRFVTSGSRGWAEHYADKGAIFVRIGNLTRDSVSVDLSDIQYVDPPPGAEGERTRIEPGDLLFSITAYLGSVAIAPNNLSGAYINQHIALVRLAQEALMPSFAAYVALSNVGQAQLNGQGYGGTKMQLALDDVGALWLPIPPKPEQRAIVDYIAAETAKLDALRSATERTIALLKERRAALIAAAVTGRMTIHESTEANVPGGRYEN